VKVEFQRSRVVYYGLQAVSIFVSRKALSCVPAQINRVYNATASE